MKRTREMMVVVAAVGVVVMGMREVGMTVVLTFHVSGGCVVEELVAMVVGDCDVVLGRENCERDGEWGGYCNVM
ncbi:hypothetical protein E2C01_040567 [Portunus trituberculatus]|uniref:Uncharacterized protein n=1 Tax=Portunus trituberculatus TaxID=210409 RepID=A0A5B7FNC3_PORTR|nr:hypothetical protein [Portunus trituberculatus]